MKNELEQLRKDMVEAATAATSLEALEAVRVEALGKKGRLTEIMKCLGGLPAESRREAGFAINRVKDSIEDAIATRRHALEDALLAERLRTETIDVTLPPRPDPLAGGAVHPISQTIDEVTAILGEMGFVVAEGPDIEDDFHNFTALNIPPDHPARQMHDTFYLPAGAGGEAKVLRTHTSPVQIRAMMARTPPLRILATGRTYRCDSDITHTPMFHQVEGLIVDRSAHMGHLKGCLTDFCRAFFEVDDLPLRFRPSFFPFTEPSAEVDIGCSRKEGEITIGAFGDWLEILGCGMVHPRVLNACGIDPSDYQGFAFGLGVERLAMLKYGIADLRTFFDADLRWLGHYGFAALDVPSLVLGAAR
jgi:phenylalanyl-tRNA synthetase alpha chain